MADATQGTCTGPKTHIIIIGKRGNWVVRPGRLNVRAKDTVIWMAIETNAQIFIPSTQLFERRILDVADGKDAAFVVPENVPYRIYPYSIFCDTPNTFAQGGSDPELIVGP